MLKKNYLIVYYIFRLIGSKIIRLIELAYLRAIWSVNNINNHTYPVNFFPMDLVLVGDYSYGPIEVYTYYAEGEGLVIGKYCSIAKDVKFILGGNHRMDCLMTYPIINKFGKDQINQSITKGKIILEDDVWIGVGVILLSGIRIGQGCVIAAGSVVTKSFPPFSLIGGNPAKIIKMRFENEVILLLEKSNIKLGSINPQTIINNIELFDSELNEKATQNIISYIQK